MLTWHWEYFDFLSFKSKDFKCPWGEFWNVNSFICELGLNILLQLNQTTYIHNKCSCLAPLVSRVTQNQDSLFKMQSTKSLPEITWIHVSEEMLVATYLFPAYVIFKSQTVEILCFWWDTGMSSPDEVTWTSWVRNVFWRSVWDSSDPN